jgi:hypothetical protein
MKTLLYSTMDLKNAAEGVNEAAVIKKAQETVGITMVKFEGFTDDDFKNRKEEVKANKELINFVSDLFTVTYSDNTYNSINIYHHAKYPEINKNTGEITHCF